MELKPFRADVRQKMLVSLRDRCRELAADYINPTQLENLEQRLDAVLEEEIDKMIEADKTDASTPNRFLSNLNNRFARYLCRHIDTRRVEQ